MKPSILPFYNCLNDSGHSILGQHLKSFSCAKGQVVRGSGEEQYGMIAVEEGFLSVSLLSEEGREVTLFRLRKGDVCFLPSGNAKAGVSFDVTVEAENDTKLSTLPSASVRLLSDANPAFAAFVHESLMRNFSDTVKLLQNVLFCTFDQRLASFLYDEMKETSSNTLELTHEQIARHIGSAREVVSRTLKRFSEQGIVSVSRGCVTILDKERLKELIF